MSSKTDELSLWLSHTSSIFFRLIIIGQFHSGVQHRILELLNAAAIIDVVGTPCNNRVGKTGEQTPSAGVRSASSSPTFYIFYCWNSVAPSCIALHILFHIINIAITILLSSRHGVRSDRGRSSRRDFVKNRSIRPRWRRRIRWREDEEAARHVHGPFNNNNHNNHTHSSSVSPPPTLMARAPSVFCRWDGRSEVY